MDSIGGTPDDMPLFPEYFGPNSPDPAIRERATRGMSAPPLPSGWYVAERRDTCFDDEPYTPGAYLHWNIRLFQSKEVALASVVGSEGELIPQRKDDSAYYLLMRGVVRSEDLRDWIAGIDPGKAAKDDVFIDHPDPTHPSGRSVRHFRWL